MIKQIIKFNFFKWNRFKSIKDEEELLNDFTKL